MDGTCVFPRLRERVVAAVGRADCYGGRRQSAVVSPPAPCSNGSTASGRPLPDDRPRRPRQDRQVGRQQAKNDRRRESQLTAPTLRRARPHPVRPGSANWPVNAALNVGDRALCAFVHAQKRSYKKGRRSAVSAITTISSGGGHNGAKIRAASIRRVVSRLYRWVGGSVAPAARWKPEAWAEN